jgi:hypothetical protein
MDRQAEFEPEGNDLNPHRPVSIAGVGYFLNDGFEFVDIQIRRVENVIGLPAQGCQNVFFCLNRIVYAFIPGHRMTAPGLAVTSQQGFLIGFEKMMRTWKPMS